MAKKGNSISNTKTGEKITWLETAADSEGKKLVFDFEVAPSGKLPVVHFHPRQTERFDLQKGEFVVKLAGKEQILRPGDSLTIEKGVPHQWWNASETEAAHLTVTFQPALNTETFLEQFYGLGNTPGMAKPDGTPSFLQIMAMANEYELYVAGPPLPVQKLLSTVLGSFARLIGLKKFYPAFSQD